MLIDKIHILWFKLQREDKHLYLSFPIPLYIFQELLDCILDLFELVCFLVPDKKQNAYSSFTVHGAKILIQNAMNLFDSFTENEPYYLFDVKANKIKVSAKIR